MSFLNLNTKWDANNKFFKTVQKLQDDNRVMIADGVVHMIS